MNTESIQMNSYMRHTSNGVVINTNKHNADVRFMLDSMYKGGKL